MSYESFRTDMASRLIPLFPDTQQLSAVLSALDEAAASYEITRKCTDLILSGGLPDSVRLYIAAKSVENLARGTLKNYYFNLLHFFESVRLAPDQVTTNDVRLYLHNYKLSRGVKDDTLNAIRVCLNGFFNWCLEEDMVTKNPVRRITPIRTGEPERLPMTALELEKVRCVCKNVREKALVDFLYSTACRVSECSAMNIDNISFQDHTAHVEHGKGDKARTTFLNAESEISLRAYLDSRADGNPALFVTCRAPHRRMGVKAIQNEVQKIVSRADISVHVTPHIFRHTAASLALQRGMPLEQVQRFLGHAKIQTTLRYAKVLDFDVKQSHRRCIA